jgi:hypothetical protein
VKLLNESVRPGRLSLAKALSVEVRLHFTHMDLGTGCSVIITMLNLFMNDSSKCVSEKDPMHYMTIKRYRFSHSVSQRKHCCNCRAQMRVSLAIGLRFSSFYLSVLFRHYYYGWLYSQAFVSAPKAVPVTLTRCLSIEF